MVGKMHFPKTRFAQGLLNFRNMNKINGEPGFKENLQGLLLFVGLPVAMYTWLSRTETWNNDCTEVALRDRVNNDHRVTFGPYKTGTTEHAQAIELFHGVPVASQLVFGMNGYSPRTYSPYGGETIVGRARTKQEESGESALYWGAHYGINKWVPSRDARDSGAYADLSQAADRNLLSVIAEYQAMKKSTSYNKSEQC